MNKYEVNRATLAIIPLDGKTKVYEVGEELEVIDSTMKIMENSCAYFGSSLEGRRRGSASLIGVSYKVPIIVEESSKMIFFPTSSPKSNDCAWISLRHVDKYYKFKEVLCIEFKNQKKILLNVSYNTFDNQVLRASRLESILNERISNNNVK